MKEKKLPDPLDAQVINCGSVFLVRPFTDEARKWIKENVGDDAQFFANALVVEHRYAQDLVRGMQEAGLTVK